MTSPSSTDPLAGKRVILTRAAEQSQTLAEELARHGALVSILPCVEFRPPEDCAALDAALIRLQEFDWIVFTSQNGVQFFSRRLQELDRDMRISAPPQIAALGRGTASAAEKEGLRADFVSAKARSGREFVDEFSHQAKGRKILLPESDQALPTVGQKLRECGANVTAVVAYRTCVPESLDAEVLSGLRRDGADAFVFASPSAFRNFARIFGKSDLRRFARESVFAAIGPTTAQAIREDGLANVIEAAAPTADAIVKALAEDLSKSSSARVSR